MMRRTLRMWTAAVWLASGMAEVPLANAQVELVPAKEINDKGELIIRVFNSLRTGKDGGTFFEPWERKLKTKQATIYVAQESGLKKIAIVEARKLIREPTPVLLAYRQEERPALPGNQMYQLWTVMESPTPNTEAVLRTFSRLVRPGTLVFILSARENIPEP
jgi:hypothetical protein